MIRILVIIAYLVDLVLILLNDQSTTSTNLFKFFVSL